MAVILRGDALGDHDGDLEFLLRGPSATTKPAAVDPGDPLAHDDGEQYLRGFDLADKVSFKFGSLPVNLLSVTDVKLGIRWVNWDSGQSNTLDYYMRMNGVDGAHLSDTQSTAGPSPPYLTVDPVSVGKPGGGTWTVSDISNPDLQMVVEISTEPLIIGVDVTSMWLEIEGSTSPIQVENPRSVGSMMLRDGRERKRLTLPVSMEFIGQELVDDFNVSHFVIPHASGPAERVKNWERHFMRLVSETFDPQNMMLFHTYESKRRYLVLDWDIGLSTQSPTSTADGVARLSAGGRTFVRASNAWIEVPGAGQSEGAGQVVGVTIDQEKNSKNGLQIEASSINHLKDSAFAAGVSSEWTTQGTGTNGSAVEDDTVSGLLFDTTVTAQSVKITGGNPLGGTHVGILQTTGTISANTVITVSYDHLDDSGAALSIQLQRSVDSFWWNELARLWQSVEIRTLMPIRNATTRDFLKAIDVGGTNTTVTVKITARNANGQVNHVQCVQIEEKNYLTSRIVTNDATLTRSADLLTISNNSGARTWQATRGSWKTEFMPEWDSADLPTNAVMTFVYVKYDASNEDKVFYRQSDSMLVFRRKLSGTNHDAILETTFTKGVPKKMGARWTSDQGEEDLANYTISVYADGSKGLDATPGGEPTAPASVDMIRGSEADDVNVCDGWLRFHEVTQQVLTDSEMVR